MQIQAKKNDNLANDEHPIGIEAKLVAEIISFLQMYIPVSLARRIVCILLLLSGAPHSQVSMWTGSCERSVRQWKKQITSGDTGKLLEMGSGPGRKSKFADIESQVLAEIEKRNCHTLRQIADMVKDQFNVDVSIMAVSRLLKRTAAKN